MHAAATKTAAATAIHLNNNNNTTNYTYTSTRLPVPVSPPAPTPMTMTTAATTTDANQLPPTMLMTAANGLFYVERGATTDAYYDHMANWHEDERGDADAADEAVDNGRRQQAAAAAMDGDNGDETDSFGSMETLSDNVAVWLEEDGEKHWISGVDANTTCADLIDALLNYQHRQQMFGDSSNHCTDVPNARNACTDASDTKKKGSSNSNNNNIGRKAINQSTTNHTKEDCKTKTAATATATATKPIERPALLRQPAGMMTAALACEYVIVKQHRHCEEYLDGSTKVFDVLPARDAPARKECELLLRRLATPSGIASVTATAAATHLNTQVSSLLSTDKDSGMGSPVGSSRSARFRRRKHKSASSSWLAQANTLHPKVSQRGMANNIGGGGGGSGPNANERLLKIILAQDETIHRQLTLLREKERQISKIEVEKHRVRERELGKNYLLETYLNGLDEADIEPDPEEVNDPEVEIFIDEPYHRFPATTTTTTIKATSQLLPPPPAARLKPRQGKQQKMNDDYDAATRGLRLPRTVDAAVHEDAASRNEIEQQLLWLEKIYTLNKQLQREEELLVKLHAKIRKHQVKRAYQAKREVLQQIDKMDAELTLQCCDIRQVEDKLVTSNEQLKHKLGVLEALSLEYLATVPEMEHAAEGVSDSKCDAVTAIEADGVATERENVAAVVRADGEHNTSTEAAESGEHLRKHETLIAYLHQQTVQSSLPQQQQQQHSQGTVAAQQLKLSKLQTVHDVLSLQQMISKPSSKTSTSTTETETTTSTTTATTLTASSISTATMCAASTTAIAATTPTTTTTTARMLQPQQPRQQQQQLGVLPYSNYPISCINHAAIHANSNISTAAAIPAATPTHLEQALQQPAQQTTSPLSSSYSDKNLLLSLHAHNAKTVKKQMFGPKLLHQAATTPTATPTTAAALGHCHTTNETHSCAGELLPTPSPVPISTLFLHPMSPLPPLPPLDSSSSSVDISLLGTLV